MKPQEAAQAPPPLLSLQREHAEEDAQEAAVNVKVRELLQEFKRAFIYAGTTLPLIRLRKV